MVNLNGDQMVNLTLGCIGNRRNFITRLCQESNSVLLDKESCQCFDQRQRFRLEDSGPADQSRNLAVCTVCSLYCELTTGKIRTFFVLIVYYRASVLSIDQRHGLPRRHAKDLCHNKSYDCGGKLLILAEGGKRVLADPA